MRARLAIKTYLKMVLILLVNYYASYASGLESFKQHEYAVERLHKFFEFLPVMCRPIFARMRAHVRLGEAEFTAYLRQLTGRSFRVTSINIALSAHRRANRDNHPSAKSPRTRFLRQSYFGAFFHSIPE